MTSIGWSKIVFQQVLRKCVVLRVLPVGLAVFPRQTIVVDHFSILIVLFAKWREGSKVGD